MKFNLNLEIGNICNIYCIVFTNNFVKLFVWNHFFVFFLIKNRKVATEQFECSPEFPNFSKPHGHDASLIHFEITKKVILFAEGRGVTEFHSCLLCVNPIDFNKYVSMHVTAQTLGS